MTRREAEKLLGGHAPGILTEAERRTLYRAALSDQALFDALMDEEALRELLADPQARARLLGGLDAAPPRVVPLWRRPGVIGAAAGILVATTAGLAVLRSPEVQPLPAAKVQPPPAARAQPLPAARAQVLEAAKPAEAKPPAQASKLSSEVQAPAAAAPPPAPKAIPAPEPGAAAAGRPPSAPAPPPESLAAEAARERADLRRSEARDQAARQADAAGLNRAALEAVAPPRRAAKVAAPSPASALAPTAAYASQVALPAWTLDLLPDGSTRVIVEAPPQARVVLLRRGAAGVEVLKPGTPEGGKAWSFRVRLAPGDALDLYLMNGPVADPARLPESGPVDGFRARIHPAAEKPQAP